MTREVLMDTGKKAGGTALQALVMVAVFRIADAAVDVAADYLRRRREARQPA